MAKDVCELPVNNASDDEIRAILKDAKTIAVVGLSANPDKASYRVAKYLKDNGYTIIPVNPTLKEWNGIQAYASLSDVTQPVDIVDIFRRPDDIPAIVDEAIAMKAKVVWMQLELAHNAAAEKARAAGLKVVMDRCTKVEHYHMKKNA
ncbi:MAG: CoA-binding protein [Deltaproteobacteria bacterium CG11_big_fil_rev_8_21_14_0_20_47_16]|nr:MAG: CoA-binding protein [Deltaproteobacteria bacterium CG11_big_fil_rev_8_21_14_0_20_47_16]